MSKFQTFYEILHFNLVILTNFLKEIWPFFTFPDLAFFETAYGQIWPFNFFEPGNPVPRPNTITVVLSVLI